MASWVGSMVARSTRTTFVIVIVERPNDHHPRFYPPDHTTADRLVEAEVVVVGMERLGTAAVQQASRPSVVAVVVGSQKPLEHAEQHTRFVIAVEGKGREQEMGFAVARQTHQSLFVRRRASLSPIL